MFRPTGAFLRDSNGGSVRMRTGRQVEILQLDFCHRPVLTLCVRTGKTRVNEALLAHITGPQQLDRGLARKLAFILCIGVYTAINV